MTNYIGIDLGATKSAICLCDGEISRIIKDPDQNDFTPSVIFFTKRGSKYVGRQAYDNAARDPDSAATLFRRLMGTSTPVKLSAVNLTMTPEECTAELLRTLFGYLPEEIRNDPDTGTVITVPAAFNLMQKDATMAAAKMADLGSVALIQEPVAAVMSVMRHRKRDGLFLVYDLSGGAFEIAIVQSMSGHVSLLAHGGIAMCGGHDFDRLLLDNVVTPWLLQNFDIPENFSADKQRYGLLRSMATWATEKAKIELSSNENAIITLEDSELQVKDESGKDIYLDISISRTAFDKLVSARVEETIAAARETMQKAGLSPHDIGQVVFVGGPTQYRPLRDKVAFELGIAASTNVNPMTAVVEGAAVFAKTVDWSRIRCSRHVPPNATTGTGSMSPRTGLHANPFCVLGVTTRDDARKIVEMAEERSLSIDPDDCQKARSALTNPRTRLSAEIAWMPGVPPRTADGIVSALSQDPASVRRGAGLPELARANAMAAALELVGEGEPAASVAELIGDFARVVESVDTFEVLRDINEDRTISGFPEVQGIDAVEDALAAQRKVYLSVLRNMLDRMETEKLIETMSVAVSLATSHGDKHGPALLDDLVDNTYEVEAQIFLEPEHKNIVELLRRAEEAAPGGAAALAPFLDKLDRVVRNWDRVAQPIQISAKSRGIEHRQSRDIAVAVGRFGFRCLAKAHRMYDEASRVIKLIQDTFSELPEVAEELKEVAVEIDELRRWTREISFRTEVGAFAKTELAISPEGIRWYGRTYPLESITRVRWGGVRHSVNGIPTGTEYTIGFGDKNSQQVINLRKEATYNGFIDSLWKAVCVRLMIEILRDLSEGKSIVFGDVKVEDDAATLAKHKFFGASETVRVGWGETHVWSADGRFFIGKANDKDIYGSMSYIDSWNVHILEHAIRGGFKKGIRKLSDYLKR